MRTIGIRELKAHLSQVLRDVQGGERVVVTDRGRAVAELGPPAAEALAALTPEQVGRERLLAAGELRVAESPRSPFRPVRTSLPDGTAQELLDWVRGGPA
jgi:prevent-host-death family protein